MKDDGYIKFNIQWEETGSVVPPDVYERLRFWRNKLFDLKLIGAYKNGIGYGNISERVPDTLQFYISGSATGNYSEVKPEHFSLVTNFQLTENNLKCIGPVKASSESLSHASVYHCSANTGAVIHIHNKELWKKGYMKYPTTNPDFLFGTPEIAMDMARIIEGKNNMDNGIIVMGGHPEGILYYGKSLDEAGKLVLKHYHTLYKQK